MCVYICDCLCVYVCACVCVWGVCARVVCVNCVGGWLGAWVVWVAGWCGVVVVVVCVNCVGGWCGVVWLGGWVLWWCLHTRIHCNPVDCNID